MSPAVKLWWARFRASKKGKAYKLYWHYLHQARLRKDSELEQALLEARQEVDHASKVDSTAIVRRLKRFKWKPRRPNVAKSVTEKVKAAKRLGCDPRDFMTKAEILRYEAQLACRVRWYKTHHKRMQATAKKWRRKNSEQYVKCRQFDNLLQRSKAKGDLTTIKAMYAERARVGRSDLVDCSQWMTR